MGSIQLSTFFGSVLLALALTPLAMWAARRWKAIDDPASAPERKRHSRPTPLFGGLAIIVTTWIVWALLWSTGAISVTELPVKYVLGMMLAGLIIGVAGILDDRWSLPAKRQIIFVVAAAAVIIAAGVGVTFITNPFGGVIDLTGVQLTLFRWSDLPYQLTLGADLFTFVWLMGSAYTTKILDGLDGLVSGLGVVGSFIVFLLTLRPEVHQSGVGLIALSMAGASAGFLVWNWHPARVFLGESGSLYIGFILGVLSIISGGKIATALLILGLPILDLAWVIFRRLATHRSPFTSADRFHLHFRLLDAGFSIRQSVLIILGLVALFGVSTLYVSGVMKVVVLGALLVVMALLGLMVMMRTARRRREGPI